MAIQTQKSRPDDPLAALFVGFFTVFLWKIPKALYISHRRHPLIWAAIWTFLTSWILINLNLGIIALLLILSVGTLFVLNRQKIRARVEAKKYRKKLTNLMKATLWQDCPDSLVEASLHVRETDSPMVKNIVMVNPSHTSDQQVIDAVQGRLTSTLKAYRSTVDHDDSPNDGRVTFRVLSDNPLASSLSGPAPVLSLTKAALDNPYSWLNVGISEDGSPAKIPLYLKEGGAVRALHSGTSGSGKSSVFTQLLLKAVLCPYIETCLIDGKGGSEFPLFKNHVERYAVDAKDFWEVINYLNSECDRRSALLAEHKLTQTGRLSDAWSHLDDGPLIAFFWDEMGFLGGMSPSQQSEAQRKIFQIVSRCRSLGISVTISSQSFRSDLLDTSSRNNFDARLGYSNSRQEALYLGFSIASDNEISPANIGGSLLPSGKLSTVGVFAMSGLGADIYSRSYYMSQEQIKDRLTKITSADTPTLSGDSADI